MCDLHSSVWVSGVRNGSGAALCGPPMMIFMSVFTSAEIAYLRSQRLGRLATAGAGAQPHVVPVSFRYNPDHDTIDVGGHGFAGRKKFRDVGHNPRVAFVVDDVA